jgi:hypothetical protein
MDIVGDEVRSAPGEEVSEMREAGPASVHVGRSEHAAREDAPHRATARRVGWLYIVATVAGIVGLSLETPVLDGSDYLDKISGAGNRVATAALLELVMGIAVVAIAVVIYPVLRQFSERLALGFVVARTVEAVIYTIGIIGLLTLLSVGRDFVASGSPEASSYQGLGAALQAARDWGGNMVQDVAAFSISALILNWALLVARLVPRWLCVWGLIGAAVYLAAGLMVLYGLEPGSTPQMLLDVPLGLQEMALALWLIVKGFDPAAFGSEAGPQPVEAPAPRESIRR